MGRSKNNNPLTAEPASGLAAARFRAHAAEVRRFLFRRVANRHDADDLAQEVFARLLRVRASQMVRSPFGYVLGIAAHVVREFYQREERQCVVFSSDVADASSD